MTDVRAIIEEGCRIRRRRAKFQTGLAVLCLVAFPLVTLWNHDHHKPLIDGLRLFFPLLFLGSASLFYTSRHVQALTDAINDPDPALDMHFAEALVSENQAVSTIGREAFLKRFSERLPRLDEEGWENVGRGLKAASVDEAERLLRLLSRGAPAVVLPRIEEFKKGTQDDRLRTAAHSALGEIRLQTARERVLQAVDAAHQSQNGERDRLRLEPVSS